MLAALPGLVGGLAISQRARRGLGELEKTNVSRITKSLTITLLAVFGTVALLPVASMAGEQGKKNTAIALGAAALYLLTQNKTTPAIIAGAGAAYAYSQYQKEHARDQRWQDWRYRDNRYQDSHYRGDRDDHYNYDRQDHDRNWRNGDHSYRENSDRQDGHNNWRTDNRDVSYNHGNRGHDRSAQRADRHGHRK